MQRLAELILGNLITPQNNFALLVDSKATTTAGGTSSSTTWNARDLNLIVANTGSIVTLNTATGRFIPVADTFRAFIWTPFLGGTAAGSAGRARLFNVTAAAAVASLANSNAFGGINAGAEAGLSCVFTANGTDEYRIDTYTSVGRATNGLGVNASDGTAEIYSMLLLERLRLHDDF